MTPGTEEAIWALASRYAQQLPPPRVCADCFCVEEFLATRWRDMIISSDRHQQELDAREEGRSRPQQRVYDLDIRHDVGRDRRRARTCRCCAPCLCRSQSTEIHAVFEYGAQNGRWHSARAHADAAVNAGIERSLVPLNVRIVDVTLIADRSTPTSRAYLRYLSRHGIGLRVWLSTSSPSLHDCSACARISAAGWPIA